MQSFEVIKRDFGYSDDDTVKEIGPINLRLEESDYYDADERMVKLTKYVKLISFKEILLKGHRQDMQSLFQPVVTDTVGLVSQQVRAAMTKKKAAINVSNSSAYFLGLSL